MLHKESINPIERAIERFVLNLGVAMIKAVKSRQHLRWRHYTLVKAKAMIPRWLHGR